MFPTPEKPLIIPLSKKATQLSQKPGELPYERRLKLYSMAEFVNNIKEEIRLQANKNVDDFTEEAVKMLKTASENTAFYVGKSVEAVKKFFTENMDENNGRQDLLSNSTIIEPSENYEYVMGVVIYHSSDTDVDKQEIVEMAQNVIHDVLSDFKEQKNEIARSLEGILYEIQDDMVDEIPNFDNSTVKVFTFSPKFRKFLTMLTEKSRSFRMERHIEMWNFLTRMAEMKKVAMISTKISVSNLLNRLFSKKSGLGGEGDGRHMVGSSSWPWNPEQKNLLNPDSNPCSCLTLDELAEFLGFAFFNEEPCSQGIPWCFITQNSKCPDKKKYQHTFSLGTIELYWSQMACTNIEKYYMGPYYF